MEAREVFVAEPVLVAFAKLDPTPEDRIAVRELLDEVADGEAKATEILFSYSDKSYLVETDPPKWRIVFEDR